MDLVRWPLAWACVAVCLSIAGCSCSGETGAGGPGDGTGGPGAACADDSDCASGLCAAGHCASASLPDGGGGGPSPRECTPEMRDRSACGCASGCVGRPIGAGTGMPFDVDRDPSEGVGVTPEGWLQLDTARVDTHLIWIANTQEGTVSKVDTRTFVELARYRTGPMGGGEFFSGEDPSRTSVNTLSDVYVGNRAGGSLTKISSLGSECPDTNGDGMVLTSSSASDVLPWGMDDCILWRTELMDGGLIRAVAAQDVEGPDGELISYVWVGGWDSTIWKLDGETGAVLLRTQSPVRPYGFALDGSGNLWISSRPGLGRLDTTRCVDTASCDVEICDEATGDACVKQRIASPTDLYGITVGQEQHVWLGGDRTYRYDPRAAVGSRWTTIPVGASYGIAADRLGFVYAARMGNEIVQIVERDPTMFASLAGTGSLSSRGVAIDMDGKLWGINMNDNDATVVTPTPRLGEVTVATGVAPGLVRPYTYSDMTGAQLRLATNPRGHYRRLVEGCPEGNATEWQRLWWDADAPPGTRLVWRARSADTREALGAAPWVLVAEVPPASPPADLAAAFGAAGVDLGRLLEVEVQLIAERSSTTMVITPTVRAFDVGYGCVPPFG